MKLITEYDKDARLILCVFARKHEKQNRQLPQLVGTRFIRAAFVRAGLKPCYTTQFFCNQF
jgi:hypothetical protein